MKINVTLSLLLGILLTGVLTNYSTAQNRCEMGSRFNPSPADLLQLVEAEKNLMEQIAQQRNATNNQKNINVIIHVVYSPSTRQPCLIPGSNGNCLGYDWDILDWMNQTRITDQMATLNQQYNSVGWLRDSIENMNIAGSFSGSINFSLATTDPNGNAHNGIEYINTTDVDGTDPFPITETQLKTYYAPAWDTKKYLNIWVFPQTFVVWNNTNFPVYGNSTFPFNKNTMGTMYDGIMLDQRAWASTHDYPNTDYYLQDFNWGYDKALAHEVGHYLGLWHLVGPVLWTSECESDMVDDTPTQDLMTTSPPSGQVCQLNDNTYNTSCNTGLPHMEENYMDFGHSWCHTAFTNGQVSRMNMYLNGLRKTLWSNDPFISKASLNLENNNKLQVINVYPNPASDMLAINFYLNQSSNVLFKVSNMLGQSVYETSDTFNEGTTT
ncbi:MAG TPA: hypothetical protein EYM84_10760, partial [Flavobacteriales bacterium]|nr:hypothetical protein [Flavobacteriales bacterium]